MILVPTILGKLDHFPEADDLVALQDRSTDDEDERKTFFDLT
jgi:hypothetical protein